MFGNMEQIEQEFDLSLKLQHYEYLFRVKFIKSKYPGFSPKKFIEAKHRDFVRFSIDPAQESCLELEQRFEKLNKIHHYDEKKSTDELVKHKSTSRLVKKHIFSKMKIKLKSTWYYYFENQKLDKSNTDIIKKAILFTAIKNRKTGKEKIKLLINSLSFTLIIKDIEKKINMKELERKKEIDIKLTNSSMKDIIDLQRMKKL